MAGVTRKSMSFTLCCKLVWLPLIWGEEGVSESNGSSLLFPRPRREKPISASMSPGPESLSAMLCITRALCQWRFSEIFHFKHPISYGLSPPCQDTSGCASAFGALTPRPHVAHSREWISGGPMSHFSISTFAQPDTDRTPRLTGHELSPV